MSTRVTASTRMSAACQQLLRERLDLTLDATIELGNLNMIMETEQVSLPSLREIITAEPVSMTLGTLVPDLFEHTRGLLAAEESAAESAADPRALASLAQAGLADALAAAGAVIADTTRDITAEAFAEAGAELGYAVSVCRGDVATGIELRREHEIVLLRVEDGGSVESDHAGLADGTCGDRQRELEQAAARRGITLTHRDQEDHGTAAGGKLILAAAARRDPSLARATALDAQQPRASVPAPGRLASAGQDEERRRARRAGGAA